MNRKTDLLSIATGFGITILTLLATPVSADEENLRATFDQDSGELFVPQVTIDEETYDINLDLVPLVTSLEGEWFELRTAVISEPASAATASYDVQSGILTIPEMALNSGGVTTDVISAELDLVPGSSPPLFQIGSVAEGGEKIFRHITFGDEARWTDELRMHEVIPELVSPAVALSVGLKVDADALPPGILETVDLNDPATTVALLELDAVVGLHGTVENGELVKVGVTCALCHSDVDDSIMDGIGSRLDGYANRDLNPGAILSLSPFFADEESQEVLTSWGPGFYDPRFNQDGINHPVLIPPIYGLADVPLETYTGDGPISYWNSYVAVTQMGARGSFFDPRLDIAVNNRPDMLTARLPALFAYQTSLPAPAAPAGSFNPEAAARGESVFRNEGNCASCHTGPSFTDAGIRLHSPEETGMEPLTAERSATGFYRTTPLRALWQHPPYFHDGSAATLEEVISHYESHFSLGLTERQKSDLLEFLKSI